MIGFSSSYNAYYATGGTAHKARRQGWNDVGTPKGVFPMTADPWKAMAFRDELSLAVRAKLSDNLDAVSRSYSVCSDGKYIPVRDGLAYHQFQAAGIEELVHRFQTRKGLLLADEPGLGKTVQAIGVANKLELDRFLVVCPASLRLNWVAEIDRWSTHSSIYPVPVLSNSQKVDPRETLVLSYEGATAHLATLQRDEWPLIITDEGHYLKDIEAVRTQSVFDIPAARTLSLTGTPMPNTSMDMFWWLQRYAPDVFPHGEWEYSNYFAYAEMTERGRVVKGVRHGKELNSRLRASVMVRRLKAAVLPELPEKRSQIILLQGDVAEERDYDLSALKDGGGNGFDGPMSTVRRIMSVKKAPQSVEYIRTLLNGGVEKLVVFGHFVEAMDILEEGLVPFNLVRVRSNADAEQAVRRFQSKAFNTPRVILAPLSVMREGHTLTAADRCAFHDASWVAAENEQAVDRLHRIGQENAVLADFLVTRNSLDYAVLRTSIRKDAMIKPAIN